MANQRRRPPQGRPARPASGRVARPAPSAERSPAVSLVPRRRGFDPSAPFQVGRRPSSPLLLMVVGVMWVACGVIALFGLHAGWRFAPALVFVGIGLYFVRGSSATILRRDRRRGAG